MLDVASTLALESCDIESVMLVSALKTEVKDARIAGLLFAKVNSLPRG